MPSELDILCTEHGVILDEETEYHEHFVFLRWGNRRLRVIWHHKLCGDKATVGTVLCGAILNGNSTESFEAFCANVAEDFPLRKAYRLFRVCKTADDEVRAFLGDFYSDFANAQH